MHLLTSVLAYLLAGTAVLCAVGAVTSRRLFRSVVCLMGVLVAGAGMYLFLGAEFLGGVQVLVYVGGIVVVLVFAVMLTSSVDMKEDTPAPQRKLLGLIAGASFFVVTRSVLLTIAPPAHPLPPVESPTKVIGRAFLDTGAQGYVLPFEVISLLLLAAVVGGMVVARRHAHQPELAASPSQAIPVSPEGQS